MSSDLPATRVAALRELLPREGLQGFVVPRADEHQGEYVPPGAERLAWLTGFTGSAGLAIVLAQKAAIFVDGRYTLQVADQIDPAVFEVCHMADRPASAWLRESLSGGGRLGYDPWLHTAQGAARLRAACEAVGAELAPVDRNPIDRLWKDRPSRPGDPFEIHPPELAGETSASKRTALAEKLADRGVEAAVLTLPDSIAWLLNIRGRDVPRTPFPLSFAILRNDATVTLFAPAGKVGAALADHLGSAIAVEPPDAFEAVLSGFAGRKILADPASAADRIFRVLDETGAHVERDADPCLGVWMNAKKQVARFLDTQELGRLGHALDAREAEWPEFVAAIRLLALTGCRRSEILNLRWRDIGDDAIRLSDAKTGPRAVPLGEAARALIESLPGARRPNDFVFPRYAENRSEYSLIARWREVCEEAKLGRLRLHDLRHTAAMTA